MSRIAVLGGDKQQEKFMILHDNFICTKECSKYNKFLQCLGPMVSLQVKIFAFTGPLPCQWSLGILCCGLPLRYIMNYTGCMYYDIDIRIKKTRQSSITANWNEISYRREGEAEYVLLSGLPVLYCLHGLAVLWSNAMRYKRRQLQVKTKAPKRIKVRLICRIHV